MLRPAALKKNSMKKNRAQFELGFSLIETIIAISVIGVVIATAAQLTQSSLKMGRSTMSQFIAFHLAEEGLEIVRNIRDSNWLQNTSWRNGLDDGMYEISENAAGGGARWQLKRIRLVDEASKITLSEHEIFRRTIEINAMHVTSRVTYMQTGGEKEVSLAMQLTDWKKGPL